MRECLLGCGLLLAVVGCAANSGTPVEAAAPAANNTTTTVEQAVPGEAPAPTACGDEPGGDVPPDRGVALHLEPEQELIGCTARADVDMYVVTAPANAGGSLVTVKVKPEHEMSPVVELYDAEGRSVFRQATDKGVELVSWAHVDAGTDLYIRVAQDHGVDETYRLQITTTILDEAGEPNDTQETATTAALGAAVNGYLSGPANRKTGLVDWYKFPADKPGKYTVLVDAGRDIAPQVEIYDAHHKRLATKGGGRGERLTFDVKVPRPGDIYISLGTGYTLDAGGKGRPPRHLAKPYVLTFSR